MVDAETDNFSNITCLEWKDKYEKCMVDTQGQFDRCMPLLTQSFWCSVDSNAPDNSKKVKS